MAEFGMPAEVPERFDAGLRMTKRRYASGMRCPKKLWLEVNEPTAPELIGPPIPTVLFEQGRQVGELARARWPHGRLVGDGRVAAFDLLRAAADTQQAIALGETVLFEAVFVTDDGVAIVDILERCDDGRWRVIEVKQSNEVKDEHVLDVAFQLQVLEQCGIVVRDAHVMHLNRGCVFPALDALFTITEVTEAARTHTTNINVETARLTDLLLGVAPEQPIDVPCVSPDPCPFKPRCWHDVPEHHVSTLYMMKKRDAFALHHSGQRQIVDVELPALKKKPSSAAKIQWRQQESLQRNERIVERELLAAALSELRYPIAMLDFETVQLAVPVWTGCSPHAQVPVQYSCHTIAFAGATPVHREWIARGPDDPRAAIARSLATTCEGAATVMAYFASFEKGCITRLAEAVPALATELLAINDRIVDLLPLVRDHVYDPAFGGSFSIKRVLPALVPSMSYAGLSIAKGDVAASELWRVMFGAVDEVEREYVTAALLEYCKRDTEAMVALFAVLEGLASS